MHIDNCTECTVCHGFLRGNVNGTTTARTVVAHSNCTLWQSMIYQWKTNSLSNMAVPITPIRPFTKCGSIWLHQSYTFVYPKPNHNTQLVFDPSDREMGFDDFIKHNWLSSEFREIEEAIPMNVPEPRGMGFTITAYVDADHAENIVTQISRSGFLIFLNNSPIYWMSKK